MITLIFNHFIFYKDDKFLRTQIYVWSLITMISLEYRKVTSSRLSWLAAHSRIFKLFMTGKFDAYVLWPLAKRVQNWILDRSTARNFTVTHFCEGLNELTCCGSCWDRLCLDFSCFSHIFWNSFGPWMNPRCHNWSFASIRSHC